MTNEVKENKVYLHISNSGVTFKVFDGEFGPEINIRTASFGNMVNTLVVYTNKKSLKAIGEMFLKASELEYKEPYCHKASIVEPKMVDTPYGRVREFLD